MSAETLRAGAKAVRDEWAGETSGPFKNAARIHLAAADLLDTLADRAEGIADSIGSPRVAESVIEGTLVGYPDALLLARAYLGEAS